MRAAVDARGLAEFLGQRAVVLAEEEDEQRRTAEHGGQDQRRVAVHQAQRAKEQEARDRADRIGEAHRGQHQREAQLAPAEAHARQRVARQRAGAELPGDREHGHQHGVQEQAREVAHLAQRAGVVLEVRRRGEAARLQAAALGLQRRRQQEPERVAERQRDEQHAGESSQARGTHAPTPPAR
jgi:hypothetical protein